MDYLDMRGLKGSSTDSTIEKGACGKERPDRVYDLGDKILILECDEHQHKERQCLCEQVRMANIGQIFGGLPVYFIRWNPDAYKSDHPEILSNRHKLVAELIESIMQNNIPLPKALVAAFYMYHDGWVCMADEEWKIIISMTDSV